MGFDIYGNRLLPGHCEVHPYVHEEFPCSICMAERSTQPRQPDGPLCGICGKFEACADSCGVPVCSEACDHEAQRRHNEVETLRAELAAERARAESLHQRLVALEDEKNTYMDYVGDALGQDHDRETLWDAAQRVLSDRDRLRAAIEQAPHAWNCTYVLDSGTIIRYGVAPCNCWKADALRAAGGE